METNTPAVAVLGLLLLSGLMAGFLASRVGLPRVVAYVLAGMAFSPSVFGNIFGVQIGGWSEPLITVALGLIAYLIGGSVTPSQIRRTGGAILGATLGGSLGPVLTVVAAVVLLAPEVSGLSAWQLALALGVIASATDPATTVAVAHQYRARGPVTNTLLGVVALDDALGIILFSLMLVATTAAPPVESIVRATFSIAGALVLGALGALPLAVFGHRIRPVGLRLPLVLGTALLVIAAAEAIGAPALLAGMALGFLARAPAQTTGERVVGPVENLEETVFVVFFTLAGAQFEPSVFADHSTLIVSYVGARFVGKVAGAALGARLAGAPDMVVRWIGPGLIPQTGIAIGLALTLVHHPVFAEASTVILNVVLGTTVVNELVGPLCARFALDRAGEVRTRRHGLTR